MNFRMEEYGYICREKWIDINCGETAGVICQEQEVNDIAKGRYPDAWEAAFT